MTNQDTFELRWILTAVRRWLWLIIACTVLAGAAAYFVTERMPPVYKASVTLLIEPSKDALSSDYSAIIAAERLALTYTEMIKGLSMLDVVIAELGLETTPEKLAQKITTQSVRDTQLIRLTVQDESPEQSARIANHLAEIFAAYVHTTEREQYAANIVEIQAEMEEIDNRILANQAKIDGLQAQVIEAEIELEQLQRRLGENRSSTGLRQQESQGLQLSMTQVMDNIKIIQPAPAPTDRPSLPYRATVLLLVEQELSTGASDYSSILASERLTQTYAQILQSRSVLQEAVAQLELIQSVETIQKKISVEPVENAQLIQLGVEDYDAALATDLANTIAEVFVQQTQASLAGPYQSRLEKAEASLAELAAEQETIQNQIEAVSLAVFSLFIQWTV